MNFLGGNLWNSKGKKCIRTNLIAYFRQCNYQKKGHNSPEKRSAILCFNMAAHIFQCKAFSLCPFIWTTLLCTFSLFHLKCQFTAGSVLSAQPQGNIFYSFSLFCLLLLSIFLFYYPTSIPFFLLIVLMFSSSPPFSSVTTFPVLLLHHTPALPPFPLRPSLFLQRGLASLSHR